jgi:membrane associated rhomboid family serine protease
LIPYATDAPIYHFPWATIGLIVLNVIAFGALATDAISDPEDWILVYGDGLHPVQWISSNFIHGGIMHLAGNMVYLWALGLVIEGKLGWLKFLPVYFGLGFVECGIEQAAMLRVEGGASYGASAIVYGLLAMALVWAPENELSVFAFRFTFDLSIRMFALLYIGLEVLTVIVSGLAVTSSLLHLFGAGLGFGLGILLLKFNLVDCEGWDLFSRMRRQRGTAKQANVSMPALQRKTPKGTPESIHSTIERMRTLLQDGRTRAALPLYHKLAPLVTAEQLDEKTLIALIKGLHEDGLWTESLPVMVHYLRLFPEKDARVRLKLAQVLIREQKRPGQALRVLQKIPANSLPEQFERSRALLEREAMKMRTEGEMELETEDW